MEIIHVKYLPDGQPILTVKQGENICRYTFCEDALWYTYPDYNVVKDNLLFCRLTEVGESIIRDLDRPIVK